MVKHVIPKTLTEALDYLAIGTYKIMAGGTDLMIQKRAGAGVLPKFDGDILYVYNLKELTYIQDSSDCVKIGAMTPLEEILMSQTTPAPLKMIIKEMASPGIRHMATLAGNIGNASPAGDSLVALYCLDAQIVLKSKDRTRIVPIASFITDVRKTIKENNELIVEIRIPRVAYDKVFWHKVGGRQADAISKVSFMGMYRFSEDRLADLRIAFGAVAPTVVRSHALEESLIGLSRDEIRLQMTTILEKYQQLIAPIDDQRSSAKYRRIVTINLLHDMIEKNIL